MQECLSEEVVQSYLDGELAPEEMRAAAAHTLRCDFCAAAVREAESEMTLLAEAFAIPADVPTERLRERLDWALAELAPPQKSPADFDHRPRAWFPLLTTSVLKPLHAYLLALVALGTIISLGVYLNSRNSTGITRGLVARTENDHRVQPPSGANHNLDVSKPARIDGREVVKQKDRQGGPVRSKRTVRRVERKVEQATAKLPGPSVVANRERMAQENEEVKARLMLALHIASAKLNFAQKEVQRTLQRNRHEPAS